jgi:hypothetical protein
VTFPPKLSHNVNSKMYERLYKPSADGRWVHPPMFAAPHEVVESHQLADGHSWADIDGALRGKHFPEQSASEKARVLKYKAEDAEDPRGTHQGTGDVVLHREIRRRGFDWSSPVEVTHQWNQHVQPTPAVVDGHHRLAYMLKHHPDHQIPLRDTRVVWE